MKKIRISKSPLCILFFLFNINAFSQDPQPLFDIAKESLSILRQNNQMQLAINSSGMMGVIALPTFYNNPNYTFGGLMYPLNDTSEHLYGAGLWVGAAKKTTRDTHYLVTAPFGFVGFGPFSWEFKGNNDRGDTIWETSIFRQNEPNHRFFDDDGDGRIDEDELDGLDNDGDWLQIRDDLNHNGRPDHGEPNVDEDYGAVSESDIMFTYRDSFVIPPIPLQPEYRHLPLEIKVIQTSYLWKKLMKEPILPFEFTIVNESQTTLDSVYIGFFSMPYVGPPIGGGCWLDPIYHPGCPYWHQTIGYISDVRTVYITNNHFASTPFGVSLLGGSHLLPDAKLTFLWWKWVAESPVDDVGKYQAMSSGIIQSTAGTDTGTGVVFLLSIGPFEKMEPGDTAHFAIAFVAGNTVESGLSNIRSNAAIAQELYARNFTLPNAPPSPPLRLSVDEKGVTLDFKWRPGDPRFDPLDAWDESNNLVNSLPDTHWRRRNPPPNKTRGGRTFEGFRIWRSSYPLYDELQFSLLHQFDVDDDLGFEGQTGIQFTYTDSTVTTGRTYWYAVTSLSVPDYVLLTDTLSGRTDTAWLDPAESFLHENAVQMQMPFAPSRQLGKVKVVPNPYRTDMDYTYEGGGWEGLGRKWVEDKRFVWFIHLPPKCTIRIFTIAGEVVKVISHDDAVREANGLPIGQEEFYLLSESNRALASGIYVYLVESEYGTQTGKFVVIR